MKKIITLIIAVHCSLFTIHFCRAQIIQVPSAQPNIQAGINAAADGDTVLVADGTYLENINFSGKAILVASHFIMDGDTNHINNTIIDGSQPSNPDAGSVVTFNSGEDTTSVLCGFTITGGTGLVLTELNLRVGGGIAGSSSGFKIINNKVVNNAVSYLTYAGGGGIGCVSETVENWIVIRDNVISGNSCTASFTEAFGGGVGTGTHLVLENNEIHGNACTATNTAVANGGGLEVGSWNFSLDIKINNNFIHDNQCNGQYSFGSGMWLWSSYGIISGNQIWNNTGIASDWGAGGGIYLENTAGIVEISGNEMMANSLIASNKTFGGGIYIFQNHQVSITGNLFMDNYLQATQVTGGGICVSDAMDKTVIKNNTFIANTGTGQGFGGGLSFFDPVDVLIEIDGNYFENNSMTAGGGIYTFNCYNIQISNNILKENHASDYGGGCRFRHYTGRSEGNRSFDFGTGNDVINNVSGREIRHPLLINNTFLNNTSVQGGAIYCDHQEEFPLIVNSIFWGNAATIGDNIYYIGPDSLLISHCDINDSINTHIYGKWKGSGNFYEDPGFSDTLCHIPGDSPCIDAGIDSLEFNGTWYHAPDHDFDGSARPFLEGVDMGAYEYDNIGFPESNIQHSTFNIQNWPNPTRGISHFAFRISQYQDVSVKIYDLHGREVAVVLDAKLPAGGHSLQYDLTGLPDGIYLVRATAGREAATGKILRIN